MESLTWLDVVVLACAAALVGFAKTAIGGVASLAIAAFARPGTRAHRYESYETL